MTLFLKCVKKVGDRLTNIPSIITRVNFISVRSNLLKSSGVLSIHGSRLYRLTFGIDK